MFDASPNQAANDHRFIDAGLGDGNDLRIRGCSGGDTNHENMIVATRGGSVKLYHDGGSTPKLATSATGVTVDGTCTATTFSGSGASLTNLPSSALTGALPAIDGSALTGITSLVKQIKEVTATAQQEFNATNNAFADALTLTLNNTSSTSRVLVISTFQIYSSTPYNSNRFARAKTTIGENGTFAGNRQDEALNSSGSSSSDAHHSTILLDENNTSGNREYRIRVMKDTTGSAFIANCRLIAIEFEVS